MASPCLLPPRSDGGPTPTFLDGGRGEAGRGLRAGEHGPGVRRRGMAAGATEGGFGSVC